jgi:signal transduction histidine kinase
VTAATAGAKQVGVLARPRAWMAMLALSVIAAIVYAFNAGESALGPTVLIGYGVFATLVMALAVARKRPEPLAPWCWLTAGLASYVIGDIFMYTTTGLAGAIAWRVAPFLWVIGFALGARARTVRLNIEALFDAVMVAIAMTTAYWLLAIEPQGQAIQLLPTASRPGIIAPLFGVTLLVLVLGSVFQSHTAARGTRTLLVSAVVLALGSAFVDLVIHVPGNPARVGTATLDDLLTTLALSAFLVVYGLFAAAALHPDMVLLYRKEEAEVPEVGPIRLLALFGSILLVPVVVLLLHLHGQPVNYALAIVTTVLLLGLALWRLTHLISALSLAQRRDAQMREFSEQLLAAHGVTQALAVTSAASQRMLGVPAEMRPRAAPGPGWVAVPLDVGNGPPIELASPDAAVGKSSQSLVLRLLAGSLAAKLAREAAVEQEYELEHLQIEHERLLELDRLQHSFISLVTHELRTPLTSIRGYLDIIREGTAGPLTEPQERYLGVVDRNTTRLQRLVDDILTLSRQQSSTARAGFAIVDVAALVGQAVEAARPTAEAKQVHLTARCDKDLPPVSGDPQALAQLLDNLISNAIKFTPAGGSATVTARILNNAQVTLAVSDTGSGIPADELPRISERFFRASTAGDVPGTGLGLSIAKAVAENHGGSLDVRSELGVGSTFRAILPAADATETVDSPTKRIDA